MKAADPLPEKFDLIAWDRSAGDWWDYKPGDDGIPFEYKRADWGLIDGRIVAIDYAAPAI